LLVPRWPPSTEESEPEAAQTLHADVGGTRGGEEHYRAPGEGDSSHTPNSRLVQLADGRSQQRSSIE
jgi:hypothetical protein